MSELGRLLDDVAPIGRNPATGGYRRAGFGEAERTLLEWFRAEAERRGMAVEVDSVGNFWAWWGSADAEHVVATGSHLDSVPDGGPLDGPLGVASALAAVDELRRLGVGPSRERSLALVAFREEEGSRFGVACLGSRLLSGKLEPASALALRDHEGTTLAEALAAGGLDPGCTRAEPERLGRIGAFVELHVEQGRGLVDEGAAVGIGSDIWPHGRWRLDLVGRADHAGTARLEDREDPMLALAEAVLAARRAAVKFAGVATVARVEVWPNATNVVPARVTAWLDARANDQEAVEELVAQVAAAAGVAATEESSSGAVRFPDALVRRASGILAGAPLLTSRAGHDAGILASAGVPAIMLFVRNPTGVSHAPEEHAELSDCEAGVGALSRVLADLLVPRS